ncbi:hypothetical protein SUGI_0885950 [Cryptomeria japonica]|nr:hypothetical protein SUGI_0885950 [Cryptomeria japonica]
MERPDVTNGGLLYHEVQESKLCAVHCVNTVLQGPFFTELDLASIAADLDQREKQMMMEGGLDSADYLQFMSEDSSNVAMDGDFSIQVLEKALEIWDLRVIPFDSPLADEAQRDPQNEEGFICHLQDHWFCIRKVGGEWYNFNSLYPAPEHLSKFYLSAYMDTLKSSGWSIFLVRGNFPKECPVSSSESSNAFGQWFTPEDAQRIVKSTSVTHNTSHEQKSVSVLSSPSNAQGGTALGADNSNYEDSQLRAAIAASLGHDPSQCENPSVQGYLTNSFSRPFDAMHSISDDEDQELMAAIAASLKDSTSGSGNSKNQDVPQSSAFVLPSSMNLDQNVGLLPTSTHIPSSSINISGDTDYSQQETLLSPTMEDNLQEKQDLVSTATFASTVQNSSLSQDDHTPINQVPQVTAPMPNTVSINTGYSNVSELAAAMAASLADVQVPPQRDDRI